MPRDIDFLVVSVVTQKPSIGTYRNRLLHLLKVRNSKRDLTYQNATPMLIVISQISNRSEIAILQSQA